MKEQEIIDKYRKKAEEQRDAFGLCPCYDCDGWGKCKCCKNTEGCLKLADEYESIVEAITKNLTV